MADLRRAPWSIDKTNNLQINDADGHAVAWTETCCGIEKDQQNARLIAAAPELLAALNELLPYAVGRLEGLCDAYDAMLDRARAAIAKARGQ